MLTKYVIAKLGKVRITDSTGAIRWNYDLLYERFKIIVKSTFLSCMYGVRLRVFNRHRLFLVM